MVFFSFSSKSSAWLAHNKEMIGCVIVLQSKFVHTDTYLVCLATLHHVRVFWNFTQRPRGQFAHLTLEQWPSGQEKIIINTKNWWKWKKRLCERLRSGDKHHLRKSADRKHKSVRWAERTPSWFVLFDLQIFSGGVYPPSATSRTISFSISNSFWY